MTAEQEVAEIKRMMAQAKVLATLETHPGWVIVVDMLEAQIESFKNALCQIGVSPEKTEEMRWNIKVMQWCRNASLLDKPDQYAQWEEALAKAEEKAKMIKDRGLPPGGR